MLKKMRVAVLVSGGGSNLQAILDASDRGDLPHGQVSLVVSNVPEVYALERAKLHNVPALTIEKEGNPAFEAQLEQALADHAIDVIVLAGFLVILSKDFVTHWADKIINIHPSLIPSFCGAGFYGLRVHQSALDYGVKLTGATVHLVNEITDGGRILMQKAVPVLPDDTAKTLQQRVMEQAEWVLLPQATEQLCKEFAEGVNHD